MMWKVTHIHEHYHHYDKYIKVVMTGIIRRQNALIEMVRLLKGTVPSADDQAKLDEIYDTVKEMTKSIDDAEMK